jgi:hypothetical protein
MPLRAKAIAVVRPPIPPPTTMARSATAPQAAASFTGGSDWLITRVNSSSGSDSS